MMRGRLQSTLLQTRKLFYEYFQPRVNNVITYSQLKQVRQFSVKNDEKFKNIENLKSNSNNLSGSLSSTYKVFDEKDAEIVLDVSEQEKTIQLQDLQTEEEFHDPYAGINLEHGVTGVFEIEDLVSLLRRENAKDIFVAVVPPELSYVNYMVVVTGKSYKHMSALATFVRKVYKLKMYKTDLIPKIEGEQSRDWIALDLGNIALHIFSKSIRPLYDLETLWAVGREYDSKSRETGAEDDIMEQFNKFLADIHPIEEGGEVKHKKK